MELVDPSRAPIGQALPDVAASRPARPRRSGWPFAVGSGAAVGLMILTTLVGSVVAGTRSGPIAIPLAVLALGCAAAAIGLGVVAVIRRPRIPGIIGIVLGAVLNPAVLAVVLPGAG